MRDDLLTRDDLAAWLGDDLARQIMRDHAYLAGYDGEPVIGAAEAANVLEMHRLEREARHG